MAHIASTEPLLVEHFQHRLAYDPGAQANYTNTGFIVLSAVIEEASGRSYEDYCRAAVFEKLGTTSAQLHPDWRQFSGARGWIIAAADYLAFLDVYDPSNPFLGDKVKTWIVEAMTRWPSEHRESFDGLAIPTYILPAGWHVLHTGIMNFHGKAPDGRPIEAVIHSHAYREPKGFSAFHAMTPVMETDTALGELDRAIHRVHKRATGLR